jgi:hypothetical protein
MKEIIRDCEYNPNPENLQLKRSTFLNEEGDVTQAFLPSPFSP